MKFFPKNGSYRPACDCSINAAPSSSYETFADELLIEGVLDQTHQREIWKAFQSSGLISYEVDRSDRLIVNDYQNANPEQIDRVKARPCKDNTKSWNPRIEARKAPLLIPEELRIRGWSRQDLAERM